jgi:hypothetical protein
MYVGIHFGILFGFLCYCPCVLKICPVDALLSEIQQVTFVII